MKTSNQKTPVRSKIGWDKPERHRLVVVSSRVVKISLYKYFGNETFALVLSTAGHKY